MTADTPAQQDAVAHVKALTGAVERLAAEVRQLRTQAERARLVSIGLAVSVALDVTLTVLVTLFAVQVHDATTQASATVQALHRTQVAACQIGNQTLAKQVLLWDHIASLGITAKTTPAQRKQDDALLAFVRQTFAPRHCAAIYRIR